MAESPRSSGRWPALAATTLLLLAPAAGAKSLQIHRADRGGHSAMDAWAKQNLHALIYENFRDPQVSAWWDRCAREPEPRGPHFVHLEALGAGKYRLACHPADPPPEAKPLLTYKLN